MSRRSLVGALAILAIAAAIFSLIRTSQRQPVSVATGLMQSLSNVGAEQVAKLLNQRGKIIIVGMADCNDCVLGADLRRLFAPSVNHRRGLQVLATEVVAIGGDDPEPPVRGSALLTLPNVVLTPHIAGSMGSEIRRLGHCMVEELRRYVNGEPLRWQITREIAARLA
jgi:hypothetical protein